jgi:hypothetical protein
MGCICGPSVASLYVYILEKHWLSINHPILYGRFIDDIFMVTDVKLNEDIFSKNFLNLNLNIVHEKKINFLDLSISFNTIIRKLEFSLYVKPTNTFSYLHTESNHPHFIFKNIPKSLFIRSSITMLDRRNKGILHNTSIKLITPPNQSNLINPSGIRTLINPSGITTLINPSGHN